MDMTGAEQEHPRSVAAASLAPGARVRVKICGLTNLEDARVAVRAGADLLGFIFHPASPRFVSPDVARDIVAALKVDADTERRVEGHDPSNPQAMPASVLTCVGVFVDWPSQEVIETLAYCGLDLAQLHGEEKQYYLEAMAGRAFKALRPRTLVEAQAGAATYAALGPSKGPELLLDTYHPALRGGSGQVADWTVAAVLATQHRLLLAGGLTPNNVASAVGQVRPWGVDVSSGVEAEPGHKDHDKVRAFIAAAKNSGLATRNQLTPAAIAKLWSEVGSLAGFDHAHRTDC